jgi:hypothetical protein
MFPGGRSDEQRLIVTRVVDGGGLGEHKGINAAIVPLPAAGVTARGARPVSCGAASRACDLRIHRQRQRRATAPSVVGIEPVVDQAVGRPRCHRGARREHARRSRSPAAAGTSLSSTAVRIWNVAMRTSCGCAASKDGWPPRVKPRLPHGIILGKGRRWSRCFDFGDLHRGYLLSPLSVMRLTREKGKQCP